MKVEFLGTKGEVEIPEKGCDCKQCKEARKLGSGYSHLRYSSVLYADEKTKLYVMRRHYKDTDSLWR